MTTPLPPLQSVLTHALAFLNAYLLPIGVLAVLAILLAILITRRVAEPTADAEPTAPARPLPAPLRAPAGAGETTAPRLPAAPAGSLPRVEQAVAAAPVPAAARPAILVVDDSAVARAKLRKLFEANGYDVELTRDGLEALEMLPTRHFAVLVTDLEMPNMNGLELIATVQGSLETEDLPIIAITGHDELQARVHDYQSLYGIFKKPWNDRDLLKRVAALITVRQSSAAPQADRGRAGATLPLGSLSS